MRRAIRILAACVALPVLAHATPVLHQRIYFGREAARCKDGVCTSQGAHGTEVTAVEQDGKLLASPQDGPAPLPGEQVFGPEPESQGTSLGGPPLPGDPPPERRGHVQMDRATGTDAEISHTYHTVFTPSEFPFKRISALDWADENESLGVFDGARHPLPVLGTDQRKEATHDAFWGSIVVDLEPGKWVPMPSVSADPRILSWRTEPAVAEDALEFAADAADNVFVRCKTTSGAGGRRRLVWLTEADREYFSGDLQSARIIDEPRGLVRPLPSSLQRKAEDVLQRLGIHVSRSTSVSSVLLALVAHFRAFEAGNLPPPTSSTYHDLALGKKGVCRHRSYAFTITALAAGIPTRYVENELHVFVEVYVPGTGWRRINLGGAAADEQLASGEDRPLYQPRNEDVLPRPPEYAKNATPPDHSKPSGERGNGHGAGKKGHGHGDGGHGPDIDLQELLTSDRTPKAGIPERPPSVTRVAVGERTVFRGDTIEVSGEVVDENGAPLPGMPIEIYLDCERGAQRVGTTRTGADGRFGVATLVPAGLELGTYSVVARTPGDAQHAASSSRASPR